MRPSGACATATPGASPNWLDQAGAFDRTIPATIPGQAALHDELACCLELLGSLGRDAGATIVVPSSNVLVRSPDMTDYAQVLGRTSYTVVLVGPVLAEPDTLKTDSQQTRRPEEARKASERSKGLASSANCHGCLLPCPVETSRPSEHEHIDPLS